MEMARQQKRHYVENSIRGLLYGGHEEERQFQEVLKEIVPPKEHFETYSEKRAFSKEYSIKVPVREPNRSREETLFLEEAFHYGLSMCVNYFEKGRLSLAKRVERETEKGLAFIKDICPKEVFQAIKRQKKKFLKMLDDDNWDIKRQARELVNAVCFFARLKRAALSGRVPEGILLILLAGERKEILEELEKLLSTAVEDFIKNPELAPLETRRTVLDMELYTKNGYFTECLEEGLGFCIGDTIYMCSLSESQVWRWQEAAQVLAYYILGHIESGRREMFSGQYICKECLIRKIAIYRARFGETEVHDIWDYGELQDMIEAKRRIEDWKDFKSCGNVRQIGRQKMWHSQALRTNDVLFQFPLAIKRDILLVLEQEEILYGFLQDCKTNSIHLTELYLRSDRIFKSEEYRAKPMEGFWKVWEQEKEGEWIIRVTISRRDDRRISDYDCWEEKDEAAADRRCFNSITERQCRQRGWYIKLEREELAKLLAESLSVKPVHQFSRRMCYLAQIDRKALGWEEEENLENISKLIRIFRYTVKSHIEELAIVEKFFEPDPEGRIKETLVSFPIDYHKNPCLWIKETGQAFLGRECLQRGDYAQILLMLLEKCLPMWRRNPYREEG